jgi:hypothetical protein
MDNRILHIQQRELSNPPHSQPHLSLSLSETWHIHRNILVTDLSDAQLTITVSAPALDAPPENNRARVVIPQSDGDGVEDCQDYIATKKTDQSLESRNSTF